MRLVFFGRGGVSCLHLLSCGMQLCWCGISVDEDRPWTLLCSPTQPYAKIFCSRISLVEFLWLANLNLETKARYDLTLTSFRPNSSYHSSFSELMAFLYSIRTKAYIKNTMSFDNQSQATWIVILNFRKPHITSSKDIQLQTCLQLMFNLFVLI